MKVAFQREMGLFLAMTLAAPAGAAQPLQGDEWRELADGNTVFYDASGQPEGREYYYPGQNFSIYQTTDGKCYEGPWAYDDGRFCFWYADIFQCFAYYRRGDEIFSKADEGGRELRVTRIEPGWDLSCTP